MNLSPDEDQLIYSYLFEADAVTPVGKLRYGVVCRISALLPLSAAPSMPSSESGRSSYLTPAALYTCSIFHMTATLSRMFCPCRAGRLSARRDILHPSRQLSAPCQPICRGFSRDIAAVRRAVQCVPSEVSVQVSLLRSPQ